MKTTEIILTLVTIFLIIVSLLIMDARVRVLETAINSTQETQ